METRPYRIWKFINSPIIVVIVGVVVWTMMNALLTQHMMQRNYDKILNRATNVVNSIEKPMNAFKLAQDRDALIATEVASNIIAVGYQKVPTRNNQEKYVVTVANSSGKTVRDIYFSAQFFDADGHLLDAETRAASINGMMKPTETNILSITRSLGEYKPTETACTQNASASMILTVRDLEVVSLDSSVME